MKPRACLALGVACLVSAHVLATLAWPQRPAAASQEYFPDENLAEVFVELEPGEFAGTLMLGGLRGLVTDLLWLRATGAKEAGRFYESVALFQLISKVQPRFEQVWEFMAHDMAYNIAVEVGPEEKWGWFQAGVDASLRGVLRNPRSARLLRFTAWMLHHKGETMMDRFERHDWSGQLNPVFERYPETVSLLATGSLGADVAGGVAVTLEQGQLENGDVVLIFRGDEYLAEAVAAVNGASVLIRPTAGLPEQRDDLRVVRSSSNFEASARVYACSLAQSKRSGIRAYSYVRRLIALAMTKDGNRLRNRGLHRAALLRWLEALDEWGEVLRWSIDPDNGQDEAAQARTFDSYQRNAGRLRRRAARLAEDLAGDILLGKATGLAILYGDNREARRYLAFPGWNDRAVTSGVQWYDELVTGEQ